MFIGSLQILLLLFTILQCKSQLQLQLQLQLPVAITPTCPTYDRQGANQDNPFCKFTYLIDKAAYQPNVLFLGMNFRSCTSQNVTTVTAGLVHPHVVAGCACPNISSCSSCSNPVYCLTPLVIEAPINNGNCPQGQVCCPYEERAFCPVRC